MNNFIKFMTFYAVIFILFAFAWPLMPSLPFGYLPGDTQTQVGDVTLYLTFGSTLLVTGLLTFVLYIFQRF